MKKNNKGFVLAETLVVTVFVMLIFTIIYANFYPILGKYQEREFFDDIDSKYNAYWIKRFLQDKNILPDYSWEVIKAHIDLNGGYEFICTTASENNPNRPYDGCKLIPHPDYKKLVQSYFVTANVQHLYITKYNLEPSQHLGDTAPSIKHFKGKEGPTYLKTFKEGTNGASLFNAAYGYSGSHGNVLIKHEATDVPDYIADQDIFNRYHVVGDVKEQTRRYIDYLPAYKFPSKRDAKYRIIVEFSRINDDSKDTKSNNSIHTFSTMELKR